MNIVFLQEIIEDTCLLDRACRPIPHIELVRLGIFIRNTLEGEFLLDCFNFSFIETENADPIRACLPSQPLCLT